MSTRILLGVKTAGAKADNLPPSSADVTESGSLNLPEPSGPHRPVMGLLSLYLFLQEMSFFKSQKIFRKVTFNLLS
jgi:hypothetical protein